MNPLNWCFTVLIDLPAQQRCPSEQNRGGDHVPLMVAMMSPLTCGFVRHPDQQPPDQGRWRSSQISRFSSNDEGYHEGFDEPHPSSWSTWTPSRSTSFELDARPSVLHLAGRGNRRDDMTTTPISPTSMVRPFEGGPPSALSGMEVLIEAAVERAIGRSLGPYLSRLSVCEPAVYTVAQAAEVLQVSEDTVGRIVRRGVLPRVPHVGGKILIPRRALDRLIESAEASPEKASIRADPPNGTPLRRRSKHSVAS
jgi:excisionase family DNA binding protein